MIQQKWGGPPGNLLLLAVLMVVGAVFAQDARALFAEGLKAYAAEDYERAMSLFEKAAKAEPGVPQYHQWLAKATGRRAERVNPLRAWGLAGKVRAGFEKAAQMSGSDVEILSDLFEFYLQAPGMVGGGEDKARKVAEKIAQLSPGEGHRVRAALLLKKKDYAGAERELRKALELEPDKLSRILDLASFLAERGRNEEADKLFARAAELAPNSPKYLFARGKQLALSRRDPQEARRLLSEYLQSPRQPDDPPPSEVQGILKKL